ncbi:hypothetical protein Hte_010510 [Hypoxylon texense]
MDQPRYLPEALAAMERAAQFSFDCQRPDGHWVAEVSADVTFTSEYVMFKYAVGLDLKSDGDAIRRWLLQDQKEDGSWGLAPELEGNVSTTTEAYLALKILGVPSDHEAMLRAKGFMVGNGGVAKVRFFTRFFLATFGLFPWTAIPQLPAELILMPPSSPLNIYTLSSWARSTLIPILLVHHHQPVYPLPNGLSHDNNFLDELWVEPGNKNVPFVPPLNDLFWQREWIKFGFTAIDKVIAQAGGLRHQPLRGVARKKCVEWLLEHQEGTGEWAGFFPPMHGSIWALLLEGFPLNHEVIRLGLVGLEGLAIEDACGKRIAATVSPVWDTALMAGALCEAGFGLDTRILKAVNWIKRKQISGHQGDWRIYSRNTQAGGWSFEYHNTWYPDVDDTAVVIMTLARQDPGLTSTESISSAVEWILGMQNHDGGWAAFDTNNDKLWLHKIPFSDMDSLCDPSSADITGRILECFGVLLDQRKSRLNRRLEKKVTAASWRGISYLIKEQEASGAWWGRWGNNYIYGTSNVLRGMVHFARRDPRARHSAVRALRWFESIQNADGGWGETLKSYDFPELAGKGVSTAAQTAWALEALLPYRAVSNKCIEDGVRWLIDNQTIESEHGASWPTDVYTGTGFPKVLYLGYPYYHHAFPIKALSQYVRSTQRIGLESLSLPSHVLDVLRRPDVIMIVSGSRGDISPFLRIGVELQRSYGCRIRIASHMSHRQAVEEHGFELYPIAGSPSEFAKIFTEKPDILGSFIRGDFHALLVLFKRMLEDCLRSTIGDSRLTFDAKAMSNRPFIADIVLSNPPTLAHSYAAEALQIPLLLVSIQPTLPTTAFPHPLTMSKSGIPRKTRWNYLSYWGLEVANQLAFGYFLRTRAEKIFQGSTRPLRWLTSGSKKREVPYVGLWSSLVLPRPADWDETATIAGYAFSRAGDDYLPPQSLQFFLTSDRPVVAISFGSMGIANPEKFMLVLSQAVEGAGAKAVVCGSWPTAAMKMHIPDHMYLVEDIPHDWLLRHVRGFIHHGGAGHTAVGLRFGVPMLIVPFCLDQNFWAAKVHHLGLGPPPIPYREVTMQVLKESLRDLLSEKYDERCRQKASKLSLDTDGAKVAADLAARELMSAGTTEPCSIIPQIEAHWRHDESGLALSGAVAAALVSQGLLDWSDMDLRRGHKQADQNISAFLLVRALVLLWGALYSILEIICGVSRSPGENPVRQARINQSLFDLELIQNHGVELEMLARSWQAAVTGKFIGQVAKTYHDQEGAA